MSNPTPAQLIQEIIPLNAAESFARISQAANATETVDLYPASGMNSLRAAAAEDGIDLLKDYASNGSLSTYYAAMFARGSGELRIPGITDRSRRTTHPNNPNVPLVVDPYPTNPDGSVQNDMPAIFMQAEAAGIASGGLEHSFFLNGRHILDVNDSVVFTSGFSAEIFDSTAANADAIRVTENQSGYSVNIGGQNITLTRAQLQDIQSRSFGGVEAENPDGSYKPTSVVLGNENQHDALDAYGAAKVVAAGVVTAHLHEQSDEMEVTYNGSIPTEIPNNVRTAAAAR